MLSDAQLATYFDEHPLPLAGRQYIEQANRGPSRRVGSGIAQIAVRYASARWRMTLQAESYTGEHGYVLTKELDEACVALLDQPPPRKVRWVPPSSRARVFNWTPDFLSLDLRGPQIIEFKPERNAKQLMLKRPGLWVQEGNTWRCPPYEEATAELGIPFKVVTDLDLNFCLCDNIRFLLDYRNRPRPEADENRDHEIIEIVDRKIGITLDQLIPPLGPFNADDIYWLVVTKRIYIDLARAPLRYPTRCLVFPDKQISDMFTR